jgi:hypothetical protein
MGKRLHEQHPAAASEAGKGCKQRCHPRKILKGLGIASAK